MRGKSVPGLLLLAVLFLGAALAGFLAPYPYRAQHRSYFYGPPTRIHFVDGAGRFHWRPFVYAQRPTGPDPSYEEDRQRPYALRFFVAGEPYRILGIVPARTHLLDVEAPAVLALLGTDGLGRDIFSRLLFASQVSLSIGLVGILCSFGPGLLLGAVAGYLGGWWDRIIMRIADLLVTLPGLFLVLALRSLFPLDLDSRTAYLLMVAIFGMIGWSSLARILRGLLLSLKEQEFVLSARAVGATGSSILFRHLLPHAYTPLLVHATLAIPSFILGETALSFLGMGIHEPYPSWGNMLREALSWHVLTSHGWVLSPAVAIFLTVLAFNLVGDGLRDFLDPKTRRLAREPWFLRG